MNILELKKEAEKLLKERFVGYVINKSIDGSKMQILCKDYQGRIYHIQGLERIYTKSEKENYFDLYTDVVKVLSK